jgi:chromosome segregation ATPase
MSIHPRLESRVSALERRQLSLEIRVEELADDITTGLKQLSDDMTASFKQLEDYQIQTEHQIDIRFNEIDARFNQVDARFNKIENDIAAIKATMATKDDLATTENRLLDAFQQLITMINPQRPPE